MKTPRELLPDEIKFLNDQMLRASIENAKVNELMARLRLECGVNMSAILNENFEWVLPSSGKRILRSE